MNPARGGGSGPYVGPGRPARSPAVAPGGDPSRAPAPPFVPRDPEAGPRAGGTGERAGHPPPPAVPGSVAYEEWGAAPSASVGASAAVARPTAASPPVGSADAVADALETVALRVRTGELAPLGFQQGMSDAAAVATALTALLAADR